MKLKSSKTTCNFNHAIVLIIVSRVLLLNSFCQTTSQSICTHNTPTFYRNAYIRTGMNLNFFLGEVVLWYSIYVLLAEIRTTWVANTHLFTYTLTVKGPIFWSKRRNYSNSNTYSSKLRKLAVSKFCWKSVELQKLKYFNTPLDKTQRTLKPSHKGIRTTIFVPHCRRKAKQFEAHPIFKSLLETKTFSNKTKINYRLCLSI